MCAAIPFIWPVRWRTRPPAARSAQQTAEILAQIDALLAEAGTDKTKIVMATIYLADISTFGEMNVEWDKWVVEGETPARATVEAKLVAPEYKVEIAVVAAI